MMGRLCLAVLAACFWQFVFATSGARAFDEPKEHDEKRGGDRPYVEPCIEKTVRQIPLTLAGGASTVRSILVLTERSLYFAPTFGGIHQENADKVEVGNVLGIVGGLLGGGQPAASGPGARVGTVSFAGATLLIDVRRNRNLTPWPEDYWSLSTAVTTQASAPLQRQIEAQYSLARQSGQLGAPLIGSMRVSDLVVVNGSCEFTLPATGFAEINFADPPIAVPGLADFFCDASAVGPAHRRGNDVIAVAGAAVGFKPGVAGQRNAALCPPPPQLDIHVEQAKVPQLTTPVPAMVCGPDVTQDVFGVLEKVIQDFKSWPPAKRAAKCDIFKPLSGVSGIPAADAVAIGKKLREVSNAWEIDPLSPEAINPTDSNKKPLPSLFEKYAPQCSVPPDPCGKSVTFLGACYHPQVVNYTIWGVINVLCEDEWADLKQKIWNAVIYRGGAPSDDQGTMILVGRQYARTPTAPTGGLLATPRSGLSQPEDLERDPASIIRRLQRLIQANEARRQSPLKQCATTCKLTAAQKKIFDGMNWTYTWGPQE